MNLLLEADRRGLLQDRRESERPVADKHRANHFDDESSDGENNYELKRNDLLIK